MKTKSKEIIYQDVNLINTAMSSHKDAVRVLQNSLDTLKEQGIELTDETYKDLIHGGKALRESVEKQIEADCKGFKLLMSRKAHLRALAPLLEMVDRVTKEIQNAVTPGVGAGAIKFAESDFVCNDLTITAAPDIEERITNRHTIYSDAPIIGKAYALALEIETRVNELEAYLREQGDVLHAIGTKNVIPGLITLEGTRHKPVYTLNRKAFGRITKKNTL